MLPRILIFVLTIHGICATLHAASVLISWDPNTESDLASYHLYKGALPSQDFGQPVFSGLPDNPSSPSTILTGLADGTTYEFILTAFDTSGNESAPSQEEQIVVDMTPPVLNTATVNGPSLELTYNEALDTDSVPATGDFSIKVNSVPVPSAVSGVVIAGSTVTLTLNAAVADGETVTVSYRQGERQPHSRYGAHA